MTKEQISSGNAAGEAAGEPCLLLQAEDGGAYLVPVAALEGFRLPDEQRVELEAGLAASGGDTQGFYGGTTQDTGLFPMTMAQGVSHVPGLGGGFFRVRMVPYRLNTNPGWYPDVR